MDCIRVNGVTIWNNNCTCECRCSCTCECKCSCTCNGWGNNASGNLNIQHQGAYIARFYISWDEPTVIEGKTQMVRKEWENNGHQYTAGFSTTITIPMTAENINVKAQGNTGLVWQLWNTIFDKVGLPMVSLRTVKIWGTSLNQGGSVDPDTGGNYGYIYIDHHGAFVVRFNIDWEEPGEGGKTVKKSWEDNGKGFTAPYNGIIPLPMTSSNININVEMYALPSWETIGQAKGLNMVTERRISISGIAANPQCTITPS